MKQKIRRIAVMLLTLVLMLAWLPANAITQAERETVISGAIQEIEAYLLPGENSVDLEQLSQSLNKVGGNGMWLYSYVKILLALENGNYPLALSSAELICGDAKFSAYLEEIDNDVLGTSEDLLNYVRGRNAESLGDMDAAGEYYGKNRSFFDCMERREAYEEVEKAEALENAENYLAHQDYYGAYLLLAQLSAFGYMNSATLKEGVENQHPEVIERLQKEGVDFNYSGTIPEGYRLFSGAHAPTPEPTPTPTPSPTTESTPTPSPTQKPTATPTPVLQTGEIADSWEEIVAAIDDGTAKQRYAVGEWKPLELAGIGTINMQLAGFELDELADGSGKATTTWIAKELLPELHRMNSEFYGAEGGWEHCEMRKYLCNEVWGTIPSTVQNRIRQVKKEQEECEGWSSSFYIQTTLDRLWIPSYDEVFGENALYLGVFRGRDFKSDQVKTLRNSRTAAVWWLRSSSTGYTFNGVSTSGGDGSYYAYSAHGVVLGFCL